MNTATEVTDLPADVVDAVMQHNTLKAISLLASHHNIPYREAKHRIDTWVEHHPEVYRDIEEMRQQTTDNLFRFGKVVAVVLVLCMVLLILI